MYREMLDPRSHIRQLYSFQGARERERHAAAAAAAAAEHLGCGESREPREAAITAGGQLDQLLIVNMLLINNLGNAESWIDVAGV